MPGHELTPYLDFEEASRAVLGCLNSVVDMALWMVTRVDRDDWIVLDVEQQGDAYAITRGDVLPWLDSMCVRMVKGEGPMCAPAVARVPAYQDAPVGRALRIESYIGVPLEGADGQLFGTLCAIDPRAKVASIEQHMPMVILASRLLATILDRERAAQDAQRRAAVAEVGANTDALTGLPNRRAWEAALEREEARCRRYGDGASVLMLDLDGLKATNDTLGHAAGDALLVRVAEGLRRPLRATDFIARLGGDEFGILAPHTTVAEAGELARRMQVALDAIGASASLGIAERRGHLTLVDASAQADEAMYAEKRARHARDGHG